MGLECAHSDYSESDVAVSLRPAEAFGLKPSGGSDYHGDAKPHIRLGTGIHDLQVPYDWAVQLKNSQLN